MLLGRFNKSALFSRVSSTVSAASKIGSFATSSSNLRLASLMSTTAASSAAAAKPKPSVDVKDFLSAVALQRKPSPTRTLIPMMRIPGMLSLGTGVPNPSCFPITDLSFTLTSGETIKLTSAELSEALQYSATPGVPALLDELRTLQLRDHSPGYDAAEMSISVSTGSQDALAKAFGMLINPGDNVLVENPTYSGALSILRPLGANLVGVDVDQVRTTNLITLY